MIKLVVCDVDGTLIGRDENLSDKAKKLVSQLKEKGILFTLASGRVEELLNPYIEQLNIDLPYIAGNGATIRSLSKVYQRLQIPIKGLRAIMSFADDLGMSLVYSIEGKEYVVKETPWILNQQRSFHRYLDVRPLKDDDWNHLFIDKLMIMDGPRQGRINRLINEADHLSEEYHYTYYTDKAIEIVDERATKGNALTELTNLLNIKLEETLAIGDNSNDIEMLEEAGIGAVVANAERQVKYLADYVASENDIDGVEEIVNHYCFENMKEV